MGVPNEDRRHRFGKAGVLGWVVSAIALVAVAGCSVSGAGLATNQVTGTANSGPDGANTAHSNGGNAGKGTAVTVAAKTLRTGPQPENPVGIPLQDPQWPADVKNYETTSSVIVNAQVNVPILEYHEANYLPGDVATLRPGQLDQEIQWLGTHGFHTINIGQLYDAFYHGYVLPPRPVLLTFDDGYESVYFKVFPLLKKYHLQATLFIVSGYTHVQPDRKKEFPTLTVSELQQMQASGLVDVEDHTVTHQDLSTLTLSQDQQEIVDSSQALSGWVHHPMRAICYPYGGYNAKILAMAQSAGFLLGTTEHQGYANLSQGVMTLDRIAVLVDTSAGQFANLLSPSLQQSELTVAALVQQGAKDFAQHQYGQAISLETQAINRNPLDGSAYNERGIARAFGGDYLGGMRDIDRALSLNPEDGYAKFNRALTLELYGHYEAAIAAYQSTLQTPGSGWWKAWCDYGIASIYGRRGDVTDTVSFLRKAIAMNPATKLAARTEKDFNPVRTSTIFQQTLR
ncbi:hypothetical protein D2Q93_10140 [Alicyclobacillaceae bacterium I2511]|nr:hypothetical protein D2Q93_10140 [Alicyclobacillaceae bacterium I2511]